MSCVMAIEPGPPFTRHWLPGKICPGVNTTAQLLIVVTVTIVRSARKIENGNGLINGRTIPNGLGLTMPKTFTCQSSHAAAKGIHENTMNARRRDFMGSLAERSDSERIEPSFIPLHTLVNANLGDSAITILIGPRLTKVKVREGGSTQCRPTRKTQTIEKSRGTGS